MMYRDYNTKMPDKGIRGGGMSNHIRRSPDRGEDPEEKKPFTKADMDDEIHFKEPKKPSGCYLSKGALALLGLLLLILIALVAIIIALISSRTARCGASCNAQVREPTTGNLNSTLIASTSRPTPVALHLPWARIRLPRSIIPSFYKLHLKVDLEEFVFSGSVEIHIRAEENVPYVILHSNKLKVNMSTISIWDEWDDSLSAINATFLPKDTQFLVIQMKYSLFQGRPYVLKVGNFQGELGDDLAGLYRSMYKDQNGNTKYLAASQLQPVDARTVFPCFDEPDLKANFSVSITHGKGYGSLSNMPRVDTKIHDDNHWITDIFATTPVMSTYLLAFVVTDFTPSDPVTSVGVTIQVWSQPDMKSQTEYALQLSQDVYAYFTEYFGIPEIVPKADHVAVPDFSAGAMENWGLVLYRETALLHDEVSSAESNKYWVSLVMAHEIAHTWFGNLVTMRWWDDLWLNEGFANTLMYFALDDRNTHWKVYDLQLVDNVYPVMTKDSLLTSHAISTPINDPDDIPQYFDSISYDKGMAVLRMLRGFLKWDNFQAGLKTYIHRYKFRNAEMAELWQAFSEAVGHTHDVGTVMDTWTRQMGFPLVTVRSLGDGENYQLTQERFLLNPEDYAQQGSSQFNYKWEIPFSYKAQHHPQSQTAWMHSDSATIQVPYGSWILGNVDYMGFYRTNYDEDMWNRLILQLQTDHKVFSAANRAGLISDAFNLARANKLSYEVALNLTSYLHKEEEYVPWRAFIDSIHFLQGMLATSNCYGMLQKYIQNLVANQYRRIGVTDKGELLERNLCKLMVETAASVELPDAVEWASSNFENWVKFNTRLSPDYATVIYSVGVKNGGETEWDYLWDKAHKTRVASEAGNMMSALGATQEPWLLWRFVVPGTFQDTGFARWTLDPEKVRMQDVRNHFQYYSNTPMGRSVALDFLLTTWDEINERFGVDVYLIRDVIYAITSLVNTEFEYNQLRQLYRDRPPAGVASKAAENSLALIRSNINWMKYNYDTISNWLNKPQIWQGQ